MFIPAVYFNMELHGDWLTAGDRLLWTVEELQFFALPPPPQSLITGLEP